MSKYAFSLTKYKTVKRAGVILIAFALFLSFLIYNVFYLSFFKYDYYLERVFEQITTSSPLRAERGTIYDRNMNPLAVTKTTWRIFISTKEIKKYEKRDGKKYAEKIAKGAAEALGLDYEQTYKKITTSRVLDVTLKKSASKEEYEKILAFIKENELENMVFCEAQSSRYYPEGTLAAHVLGFTGSDNQGLFGLEYSYNSTLSGKDGSYLYAKDASGNAMPGGYSSYVPKEDGNSIVTTLDTYLQELLEAQVEEARRAHSVQNRVTGIVMDVKTGAILAMATSSPFDPNSPFTLDAISESKLITSGLEEGSEEYKAYKNELLQIMWSNKAISETYEPGSTFKIVTVSAALDCGAAKITDKFSCHGYHTVGGWRIKCHKVTGHGAGFDLAYGLQMSCNPTMMTVAERIGSERFYSYVESFGYLEKTGIDLPGEAKTIFHSPNAIGQTELATASFGQRFKVSIITQLTAVAAVANNGVLVEPYLVEKAIDASGNMVFEHGVKERRQVISPEVATLVSDVLEKGVSGEGGAKNAAVEGYYIAAKTGTSQKFEVLDAGGNSYLRIGSTVAYAKSGDKSIAMIFVVDEPQSTVKYGSVVAAPHISAFMADALPYLEYTSTKEIQTLKTDNYVGMNIASAKAELKDLGINYEVIGGGDVVLYQIPDANANITLGVSTVYLYTDKRKPDEVTVPNLVGLSISEANKLAAGAGLNLRIFGVSDSSAAGIIRVVNQSLIPGDCVKLGTIIEITVLKLDFED